MAKVEIIYQAEDAAHTSGGVYTEYSMDSTATTADLSTDCRTGSYAYQQTGDHLYRFDNGGTWGEVGA